MSFPMERTPSCQKIYTDDPNDIETLLNDGAVIADAIKIENYQSKPQGLHQKLPTLGRCGTMPVFCIATHEIWLQPLHSINLKGMW